MMTGLLLYNLSLFAAIEDLNTRFYVYNLDMQMSEFKTQSRDECNVGQVAPNDNLRQLDLRSADYTDYQNNSNGVTR